MYKIKMWFTELMMFILTLLCNSIAAKPTKTPTIHTNYTTAGTLSFTISNQTAWEHLSKTCLFHDCEEYVNLKHLQDIATHMNFAINPCENFHAYACSYWRQQYPQQKSVMAMGDQQLNDKFEKILNSKTDLVDPLLNGDLVKQKMQQYFNVCLNSESEENASWKKYIFALQELGYLHFNNHTNWQRVIRELNLFSNSRFFISLQMDRFNVSRFMLSLELHNILEKVNFDWDIYDILKIYTNDSYLKLTNDFNKLELDLEKISKSSCLLAAEGESNECDVLEWLTYKQLLTSNTSIDWQYLLADFPLELKDQILVNDLQSIVKINSYLDQASQETLFLYAVARFINYLQANKHNIIDRGSGSQSCLRHMRKHLPLAMNYLYEKVYYKKKRAHSDRVINYIFSQLKEKFSVILNSNVMQLSLHSVQYLTKKLQHLQLNIGNLPTNAPQHFYAEYIADLSVTHNFYSNHLLALKHFFQHQRLLASDSKFEKFWFTFNLHQPNFLDNIDATAYYFSLANMIILPFAYLQLPFYDHNFWPSLLFGDLANTLGHELIHAFDIKFMEYDFAGNYNYEESSAIVNGKKFQQNLACLSKEPTKFLTERIADISGTHLALQTFIKDSEFLKHNGELYFLQFAQFFCGSTDLNDFKLEDGSHDLDSLRLNYTLSHMPEFAEVFQCPSASPMNPLKKCKLW